MGYTYAKTKAGAEFPVTIGKGLTAKCDSLEASAELRGTLEETKREHTMFHKLVYVGLSGNFVTGAGYNIDTHNWIIGQFMWSGLPPGISVFHFPNAPFGRVNLYTLTANYCYKFDRLGVSPFGAYLAGGGWYHQYASVDKNYVVPPNAVCQPVFTWWGYACDSNGYVYTATVAYKGTRAGGLNGGVGFTVRLGDKEWKFYTESKYHYAFHLSIPTTLVLGDLRDRVQLTRGQDKMLSPHPRDSIMHKREID